MKRLIVLFALLLLPVNAWATLPTLPATFTPGTTPTPATNKYVCATVNISGATNASPSVLTTGATFYGVTGQTLVIASVGGNTGVNGTRAITRIDSTHFSVAVDTSAGSAYTSGGTVACIDGAVNNATALQSAIDALASTGGTIWLNQGETYIAPSAGRADAGFNGFMLATKSSSTYTVIRTWDDSSGHLPAEGERVLRKHEPYEAMIQAGTTNQANQQVSITCNKGANYYWFKAIKFTLPTGQMSTTQYDTHIKCGHPYLNGGGTPPRKPISNITFVGSAVHVTTDVPSGHNRVWTGKDMRVVCPSCGITGINGNIYTVTNPTEGSFPSQTVDFTQSGVGGTFTAGAAGTQYLEEDEAMYPDHTVFDQLWIETTNFQGADMPAPHYKQKAIVLYGTNQAVINSHIDVVGGSGCEQGLALYADTGAQTVLIDNNFLSGSGMVIFTTAAGAKRGFYPQDWTITRNVITKRMALLHNTNDQSDAYGSDHTCLKNIIETKGMSRVLVQGNDISNMWNDGQATALHITNVQDVDMSADGGDCGPLTPAEGEGCYPDATDNDWSWISNRITLVGLHCFDYTGQHGQAVFYAPGTASGRLLIRNNLVVGCFGYGSPSGDTVGITLGSGFDVTVDHNSFVRPVRKTDGSFMRIYCHYHDTAISATCDQTGGDPNGIDPESGPVARITVQDNIFPVMDEDGVFAFYNITNRISCTTTGWNAITSSGVWDHNIGIGTMPGACGAINGTSLATGTQIVADEAAMNFRGYATHDYCLTASSPGYHAASDGTNVGVDPVALYAAMGKSYGPGACP